MSTFISRRSFFPAILFPAMLLAALLCVPGLAQDSQNSDDIGVKPIYVTARIFQLKARRGSYPEVNGQVFRMKTTSLASDEKWLNAFTKTYPGLETSLLRTESKRVFRTSKPTVLSLVKQPDGRAVEIQMFGAQSPGDGTTPGTSLIPEISLHFGNDLVQKPVTYAIQPLEIESGMTYFFAVSSMKLSSSDYVKFVRPNAPVEAFDGNDIYLVFSFSVDLEKSGQPARYYDERQSAGLQEQATKKVQPEISSALRDARLGGFIRVRVEIAPDGKVAAAMVQTSSFPELNREAVAAARLWEFPTTLFAENKTPITGFLTFSLSAPAPDRKEPGSKE
ncbi:MAG: energy transducer TonB [Blastocatellia bacterium]|nr:energy transducer TonB [Blastocatellia bacterium]